MQKADNDASVRFVKNTHGNVVTLKNNQIMGTYDYTAFGILRESAEDISNPFRYCGEYYDEELDSVYLRNRYYQSNTGRFLNEDPIKDGLNWYVYCAGEPVMFIDPTGLDAEVDKKSAEAYRRETGEDYIKAMEKLLNDLSEDEIAYVKDKNIESGGEFKIIKKYETRRRNSTYLVRRMLEGEGIKIVFSYTKGETKTSSKTPDQLQVDDTITINFDPMKEFLPEDQAAVMDKDGNVQVETNPNITIVLAYELNHARICYEDVFLANKESSYVCLYVDKMGTFRYSMVGWNEIKNIGLDHINDNGVYVQPVNGISENSIRQEIDGTIRLAGGIG